MRGQTVSVAWFDPVTGATYELEPVSNTGMYSLSPPGDDDWAVAFDSRPDSVLPGLGASMAHL
jgi:Putative collagen-binding domain of a collagenase